MKQNLRPPRMKQNLRTPRIRQSTHSFITSKQTGDNNNNNNNKYSNVTLSWVQGRGCAEFRTKPEDLKS